MFIIWDEYYTSKETTKYCGALYEQLIENANYLVSLLVLDFREISMILNNYHYNNTIDLMKVRNYIDKELSYGFIQSFDNVLKSNDIKINYRNVWNKLRGISMMPSNNDLDELGKLLYLMIKERALN